MWKYNRTSSKNLQFLFLLLLALTMCSSEFGEKQYPEKHFVTGTKQEKEVLRSLFAMLANENVDEQERFALVREIANEYKRKNDYRQLINFLTSWVDRHPDDPFNAYYLFMTAYAYMETDAAPVAAMYFNLILKNYPDMIVRDESIHLICLRQLIDFEENTQQKIWCYEELISRFPEQSDMAVTWFMLAQTYEEAGDWDRAIEAYTEFVKYYDTNVPGFPNAYAYAKQMVDFNYSDKDWTFESLDALVATIKRNMDAGTTWQLWQYRARVNFFAHSWAQAGDDDAVASEFNLSSFAQSGKLQYSPTLSADSNSNEAYLRTWGWSHFTPIWYFYLRKIYFPLDPDIHGRWEWAGVYYGEKF